MAVPRPRGPRLTLDRRTPPPAGPRTLNRRVPHAQERAGLRRCRKVTTATPRRGTCASPALEPHSDLLGSEPAGDGGARRGPGHRVHVPPPQAGSHRGHAHRGDVRPAQAWTATPGSSDRSPPRSSRSPSLSCPWGWSWDWSRTPGATSARCSASSSSACACGATTASCSGIPTRARPASRDGPRLDAVIGKNTAFAAVTHEVKTDNATVVGDGVSVRGAPQPHTVLDVYVPIHDRRGGSVVGVAEVELDYADTEAALAHSVRIVAYVVVAGLGLLWLLLFRTVWNASRTLRRQAAETARLALLDPLTGLPNRRLLNERLERAAAASARTGDSVGLILLDVDRFKEVNDTLGHPRGDALLVEVAVASRRSFATRTPSPGSAATSSPCSSRRRAGVAEPAMIAGRVQARLLAPRSTSTACSCTSTPRSASRSSPTTRRRHHVAPAARRRRDVHREGVAGPAVATTHRRATSTARTGSSCSATCAGRSTATTSCPCTTSPRSTCAPARSCGLEALLRWEHPLRGFIPPADFIPLAEQTGLDQVPHRPRAAAWSLAQTAEWAAAGQRLPVAINLSARNLARARPRPGRRGPARRCTSSTPSSSSSRSPSPPSWRTRVRAGSMLAKLDRPRHRGGRRRLRHRQHLDEPAALDAAAHAQDRPVLRHRPGHRPRPARSLVRAIVELAHDFGLIAVAEGVEDIEVTHGCASSAATSRQGYLWSRAVSAAELRRGARADRRKRATQAEGAPPADPGRAGTLGRVIDLRLLRDDPDLCALRSGPAASPWTWSTSCSPPTRRRRAAGGRSTTLRAEQKALGKKVAQASGRREGGAASPPPRTWRPAVKARRRSATRPTARGGACCARCRTSSSRRPGRRRGRLRRARARRRRRATSPPRASRRATTSSSARASAPSTPSAAPRCPARGSTTSPGVGARLELALLNPAVDKAVERRLHAGHHPDAGQARVMAGTGFLGRTRTRSTTCRADDLYLVGTSEVALAGYHSGEILDLSSRPLRYAGWSACYRREAGSYGKDTRGIIRVHQFHKVEMFSYTTARGRRRRAPPLLGWEEEMLGAAELPVPRDRHRRRRPGSSAARKFDCEALAAQPGAATAS